VSDGSPFLLRFPAWPAGAPARTPAPRPDGPSAPEIVAWVEEGGLGAEYQPLVDVRSGATVAHEALARFFAPGGGRVSTGFVLERLHGNPAGLLRVEWEAKRLQLERAPPGPLHLNLDPDAFHEAERPGGNVLLDLLARAEPGRLVAEVNESLPVCDGRRSRDMVRALSGAGIAVALDDIGAPESLLSLEVLQESEVLKFDRSWLRRAADPAQRATLEALVGLARRLGARTVLEGVERESDLALARSLGFDAVQGYLFRDRFPPVARP
jgi:EAL domain-containing protein (putative c-di-GMP-specific phosphodiesterase class I)